MTDQQKPVTDAELHAYLDGELGQVDRVRVEAYLAAHPGDVKRLEKYHRINSDLHRLYDPVLNEVVPERFTVPPTVKIPMNYLPRVLRVAAVACMMLVTGLGGWLLRDRLPGEQAPELVHLVQPAAFAHVVYSTDSQYPVEFGSGEQETLSEWLSERMHTDIRAPVLTDLGFELVGGRLLPSTNRMAAQFMYQNSVGERITLYVRREDWQGRPTAFQYVEQDGVGVFYWIDSTMGYAVSGAVGKGQLIAVAQSVNATLTGGGT